MTSLESVLLSTDGHVLSNASEFLWYESSPSVVPAAPDEDP